MEAFGVELVHALAAPLLDRDETGIAQDAEVPGGGRPGAGEPVRDVTGRHLAAAEPQREEDVPSLFVGKGGEDGLDVVEPALRQGPRVTLFPRTALQTATSVTVGNSISEQHSPIGSHTEATSGSECARFIASASFHGNVST